MSALGQKQTSAHVRVMSALLPKADMVHRQETEHGATPRIRTRRVSLVRPR